MGCRCGSCFHPVSLLHGWVSVPCRSFILFRSFVNVTFRSFARRSRSARFNRRDVGRFVVVNDLLSGLYIPLYLLVFRRTLSVACLCSVYALCRFSLRVVKHALHTRRKLYAGHAFSLYSRILIGARTAFRNAIIQEHDVACLFAHSPAPSFSPYPLTPLLPLPFVPPSPPSLCPRSPKT